jgi:uncharacterized protein (DUF1786 family)
MKNPKEIAPLNVRVLSIDVGARTQDILLYDNSYESAFKLILPSPTLILANEVKKSTEKGEDVLILGVTMGGGALNNAIYNHILNGLKVFMTKEAAYTVRDDLDVVKERGIEIIGKKEVRRLIGNGITQLESKDVDRKALKMSLKNYGFDLNPEIIAVGVEDHGIAQKGQSDRQCRFEHFGNYIPTNIADFGFIEPPQFYSRMRGVKETLNTDFPDAQHIIMDSKIAAIFGGYNFSAKEKAIAVDLGNGHTTVASIEEEQITGIFEHHTGMLSPSKIENYIKKFAQGILTNKVVFEDGGHGCFISKPIGKEDIIATGPKRKILSASGLNVEFMNPFGDTMITGNVGLTECAKRKFLR